MFTVEQVNNLLKKIVSCFSTYVLRNTFICEYKTTMKKELWPSPVATNCLVVEHNVVAANGFLDLAFMVEPEGQTAFETLHNLPTDKWEPEDYQPNSNEVFMGRMTINSKMYGVWWRDDEETYVAQEWKS